VAGRSPDENDDAPSDASLRPDPTPEPAPVGTRGGLAVALVLYVGARLVLVAALAGVLVLVGLPVLVALMIAIVVSLPLSLVLFRGLRARLARETDAATADRRERRAQLRAQLRGDAPPAG